MDFTIPVSMRQFAKLTGTTEGAVRKAVNRDSIVEGVTADKKIIPSIASNEWGKEILKEFRTGVSDLSYTPPKPKQKIVKKPVYVKKEKPEAITAAEVVAEIMSEKLPSVPKDFEYDEDDAEISDGMTKPEAERVTAILKAEMLKLALKEKQGQTIDREKVSKILFAYGHEIRVSLESYVNRVLDPVLAAQTRHEAKRLMEEEMHATLTALSEIPNRQL